MIIFDKVVELKKIVPRELKFDEFKRYSRQLILPDLGRKGTGLYFFYCATLVDFRTGKSIKQFGPDRGMWWTRMSGYSIFGSRWYRTYRIS